MNEKAIEKETPLVSVIIPIHNTRNYLDKCINSIRNQTLLEIEIILIDDGSTDGSGTVCDQFASIDSRIKVAHYKEAKGVAQARNRGICLARGKYIMFLDSDDYVSDKFCYIPYSIAEKNSADIVIFHYYSIYRGETVEIRGKGCIGSISKAEAHDLTEENMLGPMPWNKLYIQTSHTSDEVMKCQEP